MVNIVTNGKLPYILYVIYLGIAALCSLSNGLLYVYVYGHSNCISSCSIFWPAYVSTNYDAACISVHFTAKA